MRLIEIICERSALERVMAARGRKTSAYQRYRNKLRDIDVSGQDRVERERAAREQYQAAMAEADQALRDALAAGQRAVSPSAA